MPILFESIPEGMHYVANENHGGNAELPYRRQQQPILLRIWNEGPCKDLTLRVQVPNNQGLGGFRV